MNITKRNRPLCFLGCMMLFSLSSAAVLAQQAAQARNQVAGKQKAIPPTNADSVSYAFGVSLAQDLKQRGMDALSTESVALAIRDVFQQSKVQLTDGQQRELITTALTTAAKKRDDVFIRTAHAFMETNGKKAGIKTTASGLQYEVLKEGAGEKPGLNDTVKVQYKGTLTNGSQFDSSYDRGEPTSFLLGRVIPGWQEGIQLMSPGAHYRFYIPYELGYGEQGAGRDIPPYSPLIFDVELLSVSKPVPVDAPNHNLP